jgi:predicted ArsR family transcriptional regulator
MTTLEQLPETRRAVLNCLKQKGRCSLGELAKTVGLTREALRQQLLQLELAGWIASEQAPASGRAGRPAALFQLTPAGEHLFPKRYDALAVALIDAVAGMGPGAAKQVLSRVVDQQVAEWEPRLEGLSFEQKVKALRGLYLEHDAFMDVKRDGDDWLLTERNCPYLAVAQKRPALCSVSVNVLARLLDAKVVREQRLQDGHGRCLFRVTPLEGSAPRAFRFERPSR